MAREIFEYEVEIQLTNLNTKERRLVTRTEHAYSVIDACVQASLGISAEAGSSEAKVVRIGPPRDAILKQAQSLRDVVRDAVDGLMAAARMDRQHAEQGKK